MRKFFFTFLLLTGLFVTGAAAQITRVNIVASGLTCSMCSRSIFDALEKVPGVDKVEADVAGTAFEVYPKTGADIDPDALQNAVANAGFSVADMTVQAKFDNVAVKNDAHIDYRGRMFHFMEVKDQVLNGEVKLRAIDKKYVSRGTFKNYNKTTDYNCYASGHMQNCCLSSNDSGKKRIYHFTLVK